MQFVEFGKKNLTISSKKRERYSQGGIAFPRCKICLLVKFRQDLIA